MKWDLRERYDVRNQYAKATRIPEADEEARGEMERDAAFMKYYSKMQNHREDRQE